MSLVPVVGMYLIRWTTIGNKIVPKSLSLAYFTARNKMFERLAELLRLNHGKNANGCLCTNYANIPGLKLLASTTNGTSGLGRYRGRKVYWCYLHGPDKWSVELA